MRVGPFLFWAACFLLLGVLHASFVHSQAYDPGISSSLSELNDAFDTGLSQAACRFMLSGWASEFEREDAVGSSFKDRVNEPFETPAELSSEGDARPKRPGYGNHIQQGNHKNRVNQGEAGNHVADTMHNLRGAGKESRATAGSLPELLFFLHVPRTGGRTFHHCFLKALVPVSDRCPKSYDKLRMEPSSNCRLLSTHADYSIISYLATRNVSVVTTLRHPLDRVLSSYEFSIEVAARNLPNPSLNPVSNATAASPVSDATAANPASIPTSPNDTIVHLSGSTSPNAKTASTPPSDTATNASQASNQTSNRSTVPSVGGIAEKGQVASRKKAQRVRTDQVWPWSYLVPIMEDDLKARLEWRLEDMEEGEGKGRDGGISGRSVMDAADPVTIDPYNHPTVVMPLEEFLMLPATRDLIHNGATFQLAGLTEASLLEGATELRHCVIQYPELGDIVLKVAERRLASLFFVGLTEEHAASMALFMAITNRSLFDTAHATIEFRHGANSSSPTAATDPGTPAGAGGATGGPVKQEVGHVGEVYRACVDGYQAKCKNQKRKAMAKIVPISFSDEARAFIPAKLIAEIEEVNWLDIQLYDFARRLFKEKQERYGLSAATSVPGGAQQGVHHGRPRHGDRGVVIAEVAHQGSDSTARREEL